MKYRSIHCGDVDINVAVTGNSRKPKILFVHGFPDDHQVWSKQIESLKDDFYIFALDMRGAGGSPVKEDIKGRFSLDVLADDLQTVIAELAGKKGIHLVGHDWGSIACWHALKRGEVASKVLSYSSISGPDLESSRSWLLGQLKKPSFKLFGTVIRQIRRSSYVALFNIPGIENLFSDKAHWFKALLTKRGGIEEDDQLYSKMTPYSIERNTQQAIHVYRDNVKLGKLPEEFHTIDVPSQVIVATEDAFLSEEVIIGAATTLAPDVTINKVNANHWGMRTHPETFNRLITEHAQDNN